MLISTPVPNIIYTAGPTWEAIALGAVSLVVTLIGVYAKGISARVSAMERSNQSLREMMLRDYHSKEDINNILKEIKTSITALHERFDRAGVPHLYRNRDGTGSVGN